MNRIDNNENTSICAKCGGACCKAFPCPLVPQDIFGDETPTLEKFLQFMTNPNYVIDCKMCGDVETLFVRPARTGSIHKYDTESTGACVYLSTKGCSLSFEERPYGGKALIPGENHTCHNANGMSMADIVSQWIPYQEWFSRLEWFSRIK